MASLQRLARQLRKDAIWYIQRGLLYSNEELDGCNVKKERFGWKPPPPLFLVMCSEWICLPGGLASLQFETRTLGPKFINHSLWR